MATLVMESSQQGQRLIDRRAAGVFLGISLRKIDELIAKKILRPVRLPSCGRTLLDIEDLRRLVATSKARPERRVGTANA
jgi:hypothetical protein